LPMALSAKRLGNLKPQSYCISRILVTLPIGCDERRTSTRLLWLARICGSWSTY